MNPRTPDEPRRSAHARDDTPVTGSGEKRLKEAAKSGAAVARETTRSRLEDGKTSAGEAAAGAAQVLEEVASSLSTRDQEGLASATSTLGEQLSRLAKSLEQRSVDELSRDARRLAREHPGLFVAGGIALGLAMGRFFKASGRRSEAPQDTKSSGRARSDSRPANEVARTPPQVTATNAARSGDGPERIQRT